MADSLRYKAFLSYSHRDAKAVAWLHRRLEAYRVPRAMRGAGVPERLSPIFRDRDELASAAALSDSIQVALDASAALIVACSPSAAASRWVNEEIRYFRNRHPDRKVLAFIVAGDPGADARRDPDQACFPPALVLRDLDVPDGELVEPAAPDARKEADGRDAAFLKLAAGLLEVPFDKLRQREQRRQQQRWMLLGAGSLGLSAVFAVLAWQAMIARDAAREAQARAEIEAETARQTSGFMVSLFRVSDPSESRGNSITAREVLDRGVENIGRTEFARPLVKARLLGTMGKVYSYLGLYPRAVELLALSEELVEVRDPASEEAAQYFEVVWELGEIQYYRGDYDAAEAALQRLGTLDPSLPRYALREAMRLNLRADVAYQRGDDAQARAGYEAALALIGSGDDEELGQRARSLGGLGLLHSFAGEHAAALGRFDEAYELLRARWGEDHPLTIDALNRLAATAYQSGDSARAESLWLRALELGEQIWEATHPELGTTLTNVALVRLESCRFAEAEPLLRRAVSIDQAAREQRFDDLAYTRNSLGLVMLAQGARDEAEAELREGLAIAVEHRHRMLGPIGNNLADLQCLRGNRSEGAGLAANALRDSTAEYGAEHWRTHQAAITGAYCSEGAPESTARLDAMLQAIRTRWGEANLYYQRALQQVAATAARAGDIDRQRALESQLVAACLPRDTSKD